MASTIYGVKAVQPWEKEKGADYWIPKLYEELEQGRARFGWGWFDGADLEKIEAKLKKGGWGALQEDEQEVWSHAGFLLQEVKPEDYFIYINMPSYGQCTIVRITGGYSFGAIWDQDGEGDFRHVLPCEYVASFNRNDNIVAPFLARRLKLQRAWYRIYACEEFDELLRSLKEGGKGKPPEQRLQEDIDAKLLEIAVQAYRHFPAKALEGLVAKVLKDLPNVREVRKGPDVNGADLEVEFELPLGLLGMQGSQLCAVQVKAYEGPLGYKKAIEDMRKAFVSNRKYDQGLIVSTALEMTPEFEGELQKLKGETGKDVGVLIGRDLAYVLIQHRFNLDPASKS